MNEIEKYYMNQAGSGLSGFEGVRYQRGRGFFGRLLSGAVYPLLKFLGKNFLSTGVNVASDLLESDDFSMNNLKTTAKKNIKTQAEKMYETALKKIKEEGKRRRKVMKGSRNKRFNREKRVTEYKKKFDFNGSNSFVVVIGSTT